MLPLIFPITSAQAEFNQLYAAKAESSSFLKSSWNKYNENYHPNYVLDNNPATAWVEGEDGNGEGSSIRIPISALRQVETIRLKIRNGYQKSKSLLKANSSPNEVDIRLLNRAGTAVASKSHALAQKQGWQEIDIAVQNKEAMITAVEIVIKSVHAGYKYKDTCISDIEIWAQANTEYKPSIEQHKQKQLLSWISERKEEAKYFANLPSDYPFVDTQFRRSSLPPSKENILNKAEEFKTSFDSFSGPYFSRENKNKLDSLPDSLDALPKDIWRISDLALFEVDKRIAQKDEQLEHVNDDFYIPIMEYRLSNFKKKQRDDGSVSQLMYTEYEKWCERTCGVIETSSIASYNTKGQLVELNETAQGVDEVCDATTIKYDFWTFQYDKDQVSEVTKSSYRMYTCDYGEGEVEREEQVFKTVYTPAQKP